MMRQAARHGLVIDHAQPTPAVSVEALPAQHESRWWRRAIARRHLGQEVIRDDLLDALVGFRRQLLAVREVRHVGDGDLANVAWRNGPVEDIHAGRGRGYPVAPRRVTPAEERTLMRFASDGMALAMSVCRLLATERPERPWAEQVLPYALAWMRLITPSGWTLTEASREVCLPA